MTETTISFLGCNITPLKFVTTEIKSNKIVISTCYYLPYDFNLEDIRNVQSYLFGLIENIESFQYKINTFCDPKNTWIYRVYLDARILEIENISQHKNIIKYKSFILFISNFIKQYIERMQQYQSKYQFIEIYTYRTNITTISGHFGTLMRFHPIIQDNVTVCIMRNCRNSISPLDLVIQDFWINNTTLSFMEYSASKSYTFKKRNIITGKIHYEPSIEILKHFYKLHIEDITEINKIQRVLAGLVSCRLTSSMKLQITKYFNDVVNDYILTDNLDGIDEKFKYGIDEVIISYLSSKYILDDKFTITCFQIYNPIFTSINPIYEWFKNFLETPELHNLLYFFENTELLTTFPNSYSFIWNALSSNMLREFTEPFNGHFLPVEGITDITYLLTSVDWKKKPILEFVYPPSGTKHLYELLSLICSYDNDKDKQFKNAPVINDKMSHYLSYNVFDIRDADIIEKLFKMFDEQYTKENFQPFLIIPNDMNITGISNPESAISAIKHKLIEYATPIAIGGKRSNKKTKKHILL